MASSEDRQYSLLMSNQKYNLLSIGSPQPLEPLCSNTVCVPSQSHCKQQLNRDLTYTNVMQTSAKQGPHYTIQYLSGWVDSSQTWGICGAFFLYRYTSCDHIIVWLPCCIYVHICVPVSVNYSLIKAALGWWNVWISISVFWTVQQINCEDPIIHPQAKIRLHQSGFYTSTSAASKTEHRNVKSSEFTHAACGKLPTLQAVAMACYRIYA